MIITVNFPIYAIGKKKSEKIRASTGFKTVTSAIWKLHKYLSDYKLGLQ